MTTQHPATEGIPSTSTRVWAIADSPGWLPAIVIAGSMLLMLLIPALLSPLVPQRAEETIGLYEQVKLSQPSNSAIHMTYAGFFAPEGWVWPDEQDKTRFASDDGAVSISSELLVDVDDASSALREVAPIGAALIPTQSILPDAQFEVLSVEYDLQAGDRVTREIVACAPDASACVHFTVQLSDSSPSVSAEADRAIEQLIGSTEVF
ncbi:hypothetical protein ACWPKO_22540 (plasmid) [Coraliomargarita sp. W4R53]